MKQILQRLKNPSVLFSVLSQIIAILILVGVKIDEDIAMTVIGMVMAILASLGIINGRNTKIKNLETDNLLCSATGIEELHVQINGEMVCANCGAKYIVPQDPDDSAPSDESLNAKSQTI